MQTWYSENIALALYEKLSPFLNVVKGDGNPMVEPYGCYPPARNCRNDLRDWPLSDWRGPGNSPLCIKWSANPTRKPTFNQFIKVYKMGILPL